jgi:hypothetical protein
MNNEIDIFSYAVLAIRTSILNIPIHVRQAIWNHVYTPFSNRAYFRRLDEKGERLCDSDVDQVAGRFRRFRDHQVTRIGKDNHMRLMDAVVRMSDETGIPQHTLLADPCRYGIMLASGHGSGWFSDAYPLLGHPFLNWWACRRFFVRLWKPASKWIEDHLDQFQYDHLLNYTLMKKRGLKFRPASRLANRWVCFQYYRKKRLEMEAFRKAWDEWNKARSK